MTSPHQTQMFSSPKLGECRTVVLDDVRWFNVMDLCETHGIFDAAMAMKRLNNRDAREINCATEYGPWKMWFVTEQGAFRLIGKRVPTHKPEKIRSGSRALHMQIADDLRQRIEAGEWAPGEEISAIGDIAEAWGVSIPTAICARAHLRDAGLIRPQRSGNTYRWIVVQP